MKPFQRASEHCNLGCPPVKAPLYHKTKHHLLFQDNPNKVTKQNMGMEVVRGNVRRDGRYKKTNNELHIMSKSNALKNCLFLLDSVTHLLIDKDKKSSLLSTYLNPQLKLECLLWSSVDGCALLYK